MIIYNLLDILNRKIPKIEDFKPALQMFEEQCVLPYLGKEVYGCFAYGSVNKDDCSPASDIDYFMIITEKGHKQIIRSAAKNVSEKKYISMQVRVIEKDIAEKGLHAVDPSFMQHLELTVKKYGFRGQNPLEALADMGMTFEQGLKSSICNYLRRLNSCANHPSSDCEYYKSLKDIMEKPWHAMRIAVQHALGTVAPNGVDNFSDSKNELLKIYRTLNPPDELLENINKIRSTGKQYVDFLSEVRNAENGDDHDLYSKYTLILSVIESCYDDALNFIEQNALRMK